MPISVDQRWLGSGAMDFDPDTLGRLPTARWRIVQPLIRMSRWIFLRLVGWSRRCFSQAQTRRMP
jgi:hypothetical protein